MTKKEDSIAKKINKLCSKVRKKQNGFVVGQDKSIGSRRISMCVIIAHVRT